jgi:hypothetical protein
MFQFEDAAVFLAVVERVAGSGKLRGSVVDVVARHASYFL